MNCTSLNAEIKLKKYGLNDSIEILNIKDSFDADTSFSSSDSEYLRYALMYLKDFEGTTVTAKQLLSNTESKYYKYIDKFIDYKTYTYNILLSELIHVKDLGIRNISLNKNIDIETDKRQSSTEKAFNIFSFMPKPPDPKIVSFNVLSSGPYSDGISLFERPYKRISRYCALGVRWSKKDNSFVAEICARRLSSAMEAYPVLIDIDYDVKLINNDASITVNVTEAEIHK